jgi:carboxyl-terminal processing protease
VAVGLLLFLMAACASTSDGPRYATRERFAFDLSGALFANAYRQIHDYYIEPVTIETIAVAGISRLEAADGSFMINEDGPAVLFLDHGKEFNRLKTPDTNDADGWAAVTSAAITAARGHAPELAHATDEQLYQRVFDGITPKLDRFTRYAGVDAARDQRAARDGFGGIGLTIDYSDAEPRVSSVLPNGPAASAGIKLDDRLIAINGTPVAGLKQAEIVQGLRGKVDTQVILTMKRPQHEQPLAIRVTRRLIVLPTVTAEREDGIAIFRVGVFNHNTAASLAEQLAKLHAEAGRDVKGVVLDLRDNPGGLLDQAVDVASLFLDRGEIISTRGRHPTSKQNFEANDSDRTRGLPMVVLVNGGTASSSEIVAAALQDDGRAVVVGSSSYGKGTVQMVLSLENNGELTLTWAKIYAPSGYLLHQHGIIPTFCTSPEVDPVGEPEEPSSRIVHILERGTHPKPGIATEPRAALSDGDWGELRNACPVEAKDNALDLKIAKRLLRDPTLYAQALSLQNISVAHADSPTTHSALQ